MTDKEKIKTILELFLAWNGETEVIDVANLDSAVEFIKESLQEEPISKIWHEPIERPDSNKVVLIIVRCGYIGDPGMPHLAKYDSHNNQYIDKDRTDVCNHPIMYHVDSVEKWVYIDDILNLTTKEEPVSEDLEEFINTIKLLTSNTALLTFEYGCRKGANWQKEKDDEEKVLIYKRGFENCKEQMMVKAVDGEVTYGKSLAIPSLGYRLDKEGLDFGDKVKVIIIKKD